MLWNIRRNILIVIVVKTTLQLFSYPPPCLYVRSTTLWHCEPNYFQYPNTKEWKLSSSLPLPCASGLRGKSSEREYIKFQRLKEPSGMAYISGNSFKKYSNYNSTSDSQSSSANSIKQQKKQDNLQRQLWQSYQYVEDPIIYVPETTPHPNGDDIERFDATKFLPEDQPQSKLFLHQYDRNLPESIINMSSRRTSMYLSSISGTTETPENIPVMEGKSMVLPFRTRNEPYEASPLKIQRVLNIDQATYPTNRLRRTSLSVLKQNVYSTNTVPQQNQPAKRVLFSPAICNSRRLGKVILQAITLDVAESKRSVTEATEQAYQGIKFDVICAEGDFSYTIHAKKYCEATKENITCFAFR